jgi:hypothetical protein
MIILASFTLGGLLYLLFILLYNLISYLPNTSLHLDYKGELEHDTELDELEYGSDLDYITRWEVLVDNELNYKYKMYKKNLKYIKITSILIIIVYVIYLKLYI